MQYLIFLLINYLNHFFIKSGFFGLISLLSIPYMPVKSSFVVNVYNKWEMNVKLNAICKKLNSEMQWFVERMKTERNLKKLIQWQKKKYIN